MFSRSIVYQKNLDVILESLPDVSKFHERTILITGATGMIGSMLVDVLLYANKRYGYDISVYAMGRSLGKLEVRFQTCLENRNLHFIEQDVLETLDVEGDIDYIVHAASNAHPAAYADDPVGTLLGNVVGMKNMLELAKLKKAKRVIFVSSGEVYGQVEERDIPISEEKSGYVNTTEVRSCYPSGKRAAETLCVAYSEQYGVDTVIVRPSHVYGPTATKEDSRASTQFINNAICNQNIVMKSAGLQQRSYCYVADCVSAILTVLSCGRKKEAYNIANPDSNVTIREFAEKVSYYGGIDILFENPEDNEKKGYTPITRAVLDSTKLMELDWVGKFDIDKGIQDTLSILKEI